VRRASTTSRVELPEGVVLSLQGVSRAAREGEPELPRWLKRVLPKGGLAGKGARTRDMDDADNPDDEFGPDFSIEERDALQEISFDLHAGEGLGLLGSGSVAGAHSVLQRILIGALPPTTGRVISRGRVAPLLRRDLMRYAGDEVGPDAVWLVARFLHWPRSVLRSRWDEITEFANLKELDGLGPAKFERLSTMRLLFSAALHMDASIYLVDQGIQDDPEFGVRCFDVLEQRKREGAGIVQAAQKMVDDVARLCDHVIWFEKGHVAHQGRPVEVAVAVLEAQKEEVHELASPVAATLADGGTSVSVGPEGATVEVELHLLRKNLELRFALEFVDDLGREIRIEQPERVRPKLPGVYRLRVFVPQGTLSNGAYQARLMAEMNVVGSEPSAPRELLAFDAIATGQEPADEEGEPTFVLLTVGEETEDAPGEPEWSVSRTSS
jgi:ABC-2 type transport system ATP-binding protein